MAVKYKLVCIRKEFNGINIIKIHPLRKIEQLIKIDNRTFQLNIEKPSLIQNSIRYFFVDIDTNSQIYLYENQANLNANELDMIVSNKLIKDITAGALDNWKEKLLQIGIGFILGAMVAAVICLIYMQTKISEIYEEQIALQNLFVPELPNFIKGCFK